MLDTRMPPPGTVLILVERCYKTGTPKGYRTVVRADGTVTMKNGHVFQSLNRSLWEVENPFITAVREAVVKKETVG